MGIGGKRTGPEGSAVTPASPFSSPSSSSAAFAASSAASLGPRGTRSGPFREPVVWSAMVVLALLLVAGTEVWVRGVPGEEGGGASSSLASSLSSFRVQGGRKPQLDYGGKREQRTHTTAQGALSARDVSVAAGAAVAGDDDDAAAVAAGPPDSAAAADAAAADALTPAPILPLFASVPDPEAAIERLLAGSPSLAGITALLQRFLKDLHLRNHRRRSSKGDGHRALRDFYEAVKEHLAPFEARYRTTKGTTTGASESNHRKTNTNTNTSTSNTHGTIFPVRSDDSIFLSVAAFREHLLTDTLVSAFGHAKNPNKLFVGVVVQNCFGAISYRHRNQTHSSSSSSSSNNTVDTEIDIDIDPSGTPCLTGPKEVGTTSTGKPKMQRLSAPPDANGVADFCGLPAYEAYCKNGQVRVLYVHESDSLGPSMARYYASKLYGGETFFVQIDSHLRFASDWDQKYLDELRLTKNYPKSILSTYPPGFGQIRFIPKRMKLDRESVNNGTVVESPGCRLCNCATPLGEPNPILHVHQGKAYFGNETRPTQTPFLGAGLLVAHSSLLGEVPFDPYLPWTFMGEEILLAVRAWTHGWNIYAPRKNLVIHHYRTRSMGIPKFFSSVNANAKRGYQNNWLQRRPIRRIRHLCGYPHETEEAIASDGEAFVLTEAEFYGRGSVRSLEDYMEFAGMTPNHTTGLLDCGPVRWCNKGLKD